MPKPSRTTQVAALALAACAGTLVVWLLLGGRTEGATQVVPSQSVAPVAQDAEVEPDLAQLPDLPPPEARTDIEVSSFDASSGKTVLAPERTTERVLRGRVLDPDGRPVTNARVALIGLKNGTPKRSAGYDNEPTDSRGRFRLVINDWALGQRVLVVARRKEWRPYSSIESMVPAYFEQDLELSLGEGFAIAGRVVRDGEPVANASISFDVAYGTPGVNGAGKECWWADGRLEEKHGEVNSAEDGTFQITGLSPAEHRIQIRERDAPESRIAARVLQVSAPSSRTYDLSSAILRITLQGQAGPIEGASLRVKTDHGKTKLESGLEPIEVEVPPRVDVHVRAMLTNGQRIERTVESPLSGQIGDAVLSVEVVERPRLIVQIPGATAAGVERAPLRFVSLSDAGDGNVEAVATSQADTFLVAVVPYDPGHYHVTLDPRGDGGAEKFLIPERKRVEIPATGEATLRFQLAFGGRCKVNLRSSTKRNWSATYRLLDQSGATRKKRQIHYQYSQDGASSRSSQMEFNGIHSPAGSPSAEHLAASRGVLTPGTYTLEVTSPEHQTWTQSVEVSAGETTKISVTLVPN